MIDAMLDHARQTLPNECCGLLVGTSHAITRAVPSRNLLASPTRYQIDPRDHFAAIHGARLDGLEVLGAYHSHPTGPPVPSATDVKEATYPDYLYLIVCPSPVDDAEQVGVYRMSGRSFERVDLRIRQT